MSWFLGKTNFCFSIQILAFCFQSESYSQQYLSCALWSRSWQHHLRRMELRRTWRRLLLRYASWAAFDSRNFLWYAMPAPALLSQGYARWTNPVLRPVLALNVLTLQIICWRDVARYHLLALRWDWSFALEKRCSPRGATSSPLLG
jgi:hypothetical protein